MVVTKNFSLELLAALVLLGVLEVLVPSALIPMMGLCALAFEGLERREIGKIYWLGA